MEASEVKPLTQLESDNANIKIQAVWLVWIIWGYSNSSRWPAIVGLVWESCLRNMGSFKACLEPEKRIQKALGAESRPTKIRKSAVRAEKVDS